jgi:SOS response regulatory protein OraA/RecX
MDDIFEHSEDYKNIRDKILDYLGRQDYSKAKLLEKVTSLKKNYPKTKRYAHYTPDNVQYVIDRLESLNLINEKRFLENMLYSGLRSQYGIRRITQKMYTRKYPKKLIESVLKEHAESGERHDLTRITSMAQRRKESLERKYPDADAYEIKERLFAFLAQKGFEYDDIQKIIESLKKSP